MSVEIETVHKSERDHSEELEEKIVYDNDATATMDREDSIRGLPLARVEIESTVLIGLRRKIRGRLSTRVVSGL